MVFDKLWGADCRRKVEEAAASADEEERLRKKQAKDKAGDLFDADDFGANSGADADEEKHRTHRVSDGKTLLTTKKR